MVEELAVAHVLLAAVALIGCLSIKNKRSIRRLPRAAWVAVILLAPVAGPITWFVFGRPHRLTAPRPLWQAIAGTPRPPAPDDDSEFLRSLNEPSAGDHDQQGSGVADDARRREEERRRDDSGPR